MLNKVTKVNYGRFFLLSPFKLAAINSNKLTTLHRPDFYLITDGLSLIFSSISHAGHFTLLGSVPNLIKQRQTASVNLDSLKIINGG